MKFLVLFVNTIGRMSFREPELRALLELSGCEHYTLNWTREDDPSGAESAFMEVSALHTTSSFTTRCNHQHLYAG